MYRRFGKRALDVVVSLSAAIVLLPVFVLVAVLILVFDPGPVFFSQRRTGRDGVEFRFFKFRSMPVNTANVSSDQLGRVPLSWVGRFIRRTNIDELPQLLNILLGDMTLVGPRPPIPTQYLLISLRAENGALRCRPGLTGLAQINGYDGMPVKEKARFDGEYARSISFLGDLGIVLRTFRYLTKPPPVY